MRCYLTADGRLVATQADAGDDFTRRDMPDDKAGQLAFVNELIAEAFERGREAGKRQRPPRDMSAGANLARMEAVRSGVDIDAMIEAIHEAEPHCFRRIAGAVAFRIAEGSK